MSQRSAWIAAAIATAEVSEPPRPSVETRLVSFTTPWKPVTTATSRLRSLKRLIDLVAVDVEDARRRMHVAGLDRQLPALPGTRRDALGLQRQRQQTRGDLFAGGDHRVVFARVVQRRGVAAPGDQLIGFARHGGDHNRDLMAGVDLALHVARHVADAVDIGDRRTAEFHHQPSHEKLEVFEKMRELARPPHRSRQAALQ